MEQPLQRREEITQPIRKRRRKRRRRCKRHPQDGPHSPNCRGRNSVSHSNRPGLVRILPTLKPVLDYLNVTGDVFTREEIMGHLSEYIKRKSLFDPADPRKVYCQNDQLALIFGCNEFSTANACELLLRNLETVDVLPVDKQIPHSSQWSSCGPSASTTDTCSCSESDQQSMSEASTSRCLQTTSVIGCSVSIDRVGLKRRHDSIRSDSSHETSQQQLPHHFEFSLFGYNFNNPPTLSDDSGDFGGHYKLICENITDTVTDTSDDLFFLDETDGGDVVADTDEDRFVEEYEPLTYSEEEQLIVRSRLPKDEEEANSFATEVDEGEDGGDELDNDDTDSEIEEEDKWQCESCSERNHPMTRHCRKCWTVRKDWYPSTLDRSMSDPAPLRTEVQHTDQGQVSDSASTSRTISKINDFHGPCIICSKEPRNGSIIHGKTGHQVCCVGCAEKLKEEGKPCPVCRKKIKGVIMNFL